MNKYIISEGENIFDVAMYLYGNPDGVFQILEDNQNIENLDYDLQAGDVIIYDEQNVLNASPVRIDLKKVRREDINIGFVVVSEGQNLIDLAIQLYGSVDGVFELMKENGIDNINSSIPYGTTLRFNKTKIIDPDVLKIYNKKGVIVNTGDSPIQGVGYWYIENDNIVQ